MQHATAYYHVNIDQTVILAKQKREQIIIYLFFIADCLFVYLI